MAPWIVLSQGATTVATATFIPIPFAALTYDPALVTQGDIFDWTITDVGDTGNDRYEITTLSAGWYYWELVTSWDDTGTAGTNNTGYALQRITWSSLFGFPFDDTDLRTAADWNSSTFENGNFEMLEDGYLRGNGEVFVPANKTWLPTAKQTTGSTRDLSGWFFKIAFLGASTPADWTFDTV